MYIATVPNRGSPPAILLREGYRDGGKVKNRTLANLSHWPPAKVDLLRRVLRDEPLTPSTALFEVLGSRHHGHVQAVRTAMHRLGVDTLIASRPSRERDLVVAMVAARILEPDSKLATTRWWHTTTLPGDLEVSDADEDALYEAMDWLLDRQARIEQKLAARHLRAGGLVLYDLTSSYFEGTTCPLAAFGHNRDGKKGKLQVNYGLLTDGRGCPVAVSVFPGNTGDPPTLRPAVQQVRERFGIETLVIVGDRGMISQTQITALQRLEGVDWITALKTGAIRALMADGHLQLGLFDERNLFELTHPDFPGERLVACRNPELAKLRTHKRQALLEATVKELAK
ncbi:MAG: IS1634 family transposase, partial [Candidatus Rokuibacteriota bacterium]